MAETSDMMQDERFYPPSPLPFVAAECINSITNHIWHFLFLPVMSCRVNSFYDSQETAIYCELF